MPAIQSPATIAVLQFSLDNKFSEDKYKIVEGVEQLDRMIREQENHIKAIVVNLKKLGKKTDRDPNWIPLNLFLLILTLILGVNTIFIENSLDVQELSESAKSWLAKAKMTVFSYLDRDTIEVSKQ
jgi:hypothetical protein